MILILTGPDDATADRVAAQLSARGAPFVRFDPAAFPREARLATSVTRHGVARMVLEAPGTSFGFSTHSVSGKIATFSHLARFNR